MHCLLVGKDTEETAILLSQAGQKVYNCLLLDASSILSRMTPSYILVNLNLAASTSNLLLQFLQLLQLGQGQGNYQPILVGVTPYGTSREKLIEYYNLGFEIVLEPPIHTELLLARLEALIRRIGACRTIQSPHLIFDKHTHICHLKTKQGEILSSFKATAMQATIMQLFIQHPRRIWCRDQLKSKISTSNRAIDTAINRLRKQFKDQLKNLPPGSWEIKPNYRYPFIHSEHRSGYFFLDCLQLNIQ